MNKKNTRIRMGFRSKTQMPLFMIWKEFYDENDDLYFAKTLFML